MATNHEVGSSNLSGRANSQYVQRCVSRGTAWRILGLRRSEPMDSEAINRLLVVDDEAAQVQALCHTLEDEGYSVKGFTSAAAALTALHAGAFDIVLTDLTM